METIINSLTKNFKTLGVSGTIIVLIAGLLYTYMPQFLDMANKNMVINRDDTYLDIVQKVSYYNEQILNSLRHVLLVHDPPNDLNEKIITLETQNVLSVSMIIPVPEMNRMPYCLEGAGNQYINNLDYLKLQKDVVEIMVHREMLVLSKLELIKQTLISYESGATDKLRSEVNTCNESDV